MRELTQRVTYFIKPQPEQGQENKFIPPAVRFQWGTFTFPGIVDAVEETLDYWSNDGKPLRASMTLSMCQQKIEALELANRNAGQAQRIAGLIGDTGRPPGTTPMTLAAFASTVQGLADKAGQGDWQSVAAANGIENPRLVPPGQLLNLNPTSRARRA